MANVPTMFFGRCRESEEIATDDPPQKSQRHLRALRGTTLLRPKNVSWSPHPPTICLNILLWSRQTRACFGDPVYTFMDIEQRTRRSVAFRRLSSTSCALMESACAPRERISAYPGCVICLEPWARTTRTFDLANWTSRGSRKHSWATRRNDPPRGHWRTNSLAWDPFCAFVATKHWTCVSQCSTGICRSLPNC